LLDRFDQVLDSFFAGLQIALGFGLILLERALGEL
jgi:hypothetical protein